MKTKFLLAALFITSFIYLTIYISKTPSLKETNTTTSSSIKYPFTVVPAGYKYIYEGTDESTV